MFSRLLHSQVVLAGSRDLDPPEQAYIQENGITCLPVSALTNGNVLGQAIRGTGSTKLYIHLDLDILEPTDFPHLLIPTPGGLAFDDLVVVLERLRDEFTVVGSSIVEYVPIGEGDPERMQRLVEILRPKALP